MSITVAIALAKFVPDVLRWFGGDDEADMAQKVVDVASVITGESDQQVALDRIENDPELQLKLTQAMQPVIIAQYQEESKQLETINATMRVEVQSDDKFKSYWRPTFGYIMAFSWGAMMFAIIYAIIKTPKEASLIINSFSALGMMWSVGLGVLGIQISARSKDKQAVNGNAPALGIVSALAHRIKGKVSG
ncbi:MAG: hypothetical protein COA54_02405 [Thiotrichaceae bacterium]|nr:MAG: hypothetical protein COA54_02405 [Thiotrichaceae bacterium]